MENYTLQIMKYALSPPPNLTSSLLRIGSRAKPHEANHLSCNTSCPTPLAYPPQQLIQTFHICHSRFLHCHLESGKARHGCPQKKAHPCSLHAFSANLKFARQFNVERQYHSTCISKVRAANLSAVVPDCLTCCNHLESA